VPARPIPAPLLGDPLIACVAWWALLPPTLILLPPLRSLLLRAAELPPSACTAVPRHCHCRSYCLLLPPAVVRLHRVVEEGGGSPGRSPAPRALVVRRTPGACINSHAMATCTHVAVAAPEGSEDEEDEEARRAPRPRCPTWPWPPRRAQKTKKTRKSMVPALAELPARRRELDRQRVEEVTAGTGQRSQPGAGRPKSRTTR